MKSHAGHSGLLWGHPQTWHMPFACLPLVAERPLTPPALSPHRQDAGSRQRPKGGAFPFPAPTSWSVFSSILSRVTLCRLVLFENSSERTMWSEDVAPKEAPSLGVLRAEAAFLGNKEGLTAHSSLARIVLPIVLPAWSCREMSQGKRWAVLPLKQSHNPAAGLLEEVGPTRLRSRRVGGPAQAGSFR